MKNTQLLVYYFALFHKKILHKKLKKVLEKVLTNVTGGSKIKNVFETIEGTKNFATSEELYNKQRQKYIEK